MLDMRLKGSHPERSPRRRRLNGLVYLLLISFLSFAQTDFVEIAVLEQNYSYLNSHFVEGEGQVLWDSTNQFDLRFCFYFENESWHSAYEKQNPNFKSGDWNDGSSRIYLKSKNFNVYYGNQFLSSLEIGDSIAGPSHFMNTCFSIKNSMNIPQIPDYRSQFEDWAVRTKYRPLVASSTKQINSYQKDYFFNSRKSSGEEFLFYSHYFRKKLLTTECLDTLVKTIVFDYEDAWTFNDSINVYKASLLFQRDILPLMPGTLGVSKEICDSLYKFTSMNDEYPFYDFLLIEINDSINYFNLPVELMDIGDYNNDGELEWIFKKIGYNNDGYVLFYNNFQNYVELDWHYH